MQKLLIIKVYQHQELLMLILIFWLVELLLNRKKECICTNLHLDMSLYIIKYMTLLNS
jgi:hypothetical protein